MFVRTRWCCVVGGVGVVVFDLLALLHLMASAQGLVFVVPVGVVLVLACSSFDSLSFVLYSMVPVLGRS
jgi:hypothetical protein